MKTDKQPDSSNPSAAPLTAPLYRQSRYTKFYQVMLVLSTIGTVLGLSEVLRTPQVINDLQSDPAGSIISLVGTFIILPAAIIALVLLWRKQIAGLWLKLSTYAATLLTIVASFIFSESTIKQITNATLEEATKTDSGLGRDFIVAFSTSTFYIAMGVAAVVSIVFGILWWFAWKDQAEADSKQ
ncbi:hypothetical protein D3C73_1092560 [compost metagenome]